MTDRDDDLSKTMVIPNPGGRRNVGGHSQMGHEQSNAQSGAQATQHSVLDSRHSNAQQQSDISLHCENLLLAHSAQLINLASNLLNLTPNNSIEQLRDDINRHIEDLDKNLLLHGAEKGITQEVALTARYILCCLIDELVLSTPWGIESSWSRQTLLSKYHNETSGGEKFFAIINKLMEQPHRNIDLIELCYLCLSVGFRGKYRVSPTGENDIIQICNMMYQAISLHRPSYNELSPNWRANDNAPKSIEKRLPPSLLFIVLGFICVAVYIALLSNLHATSSPLFAKIESVGWQQTPQALKELQYSSSNTNPQKQANVTNALNSLSSALIQSINAGLVEVEQRNDMLVLRFISEQLFPPGSTQVNTSELPERSMVINAIKALTDSVVIVGHTDSTGRAESNWSISRARAESVEGWLKQGQRGILSTVTRGVADTQPITEITSDSRNRRVEILIFLQESL